ncbi:MAG: methionyl-tRNA formyltransferase [Rhodocyclaceae bacterium]
MSCDALRVAFAGTPAFAAAALAAIHGSGHRVVLVLTQPDRPAGRGMSLRPCAVKRLATELGLELAQPASLRAPQAAEPLRAASPDVLVVAAYGLILPAALLAIPRLGCINIHASLLPRWRGAAPIERALLAGDATTGISLMRMDEGLDTGPILEREPVAIAARETAGSLHARLATLGAHMVVGLLGRLPEALARAEPQPAEGACYADKIGRADTWLDWRAEGAALDRAVRAFDPSPGARARLGTHALKIWSARPVEGSGEPGRVLRVGPDGITVACGSGALRIEEVQRAGGRRMPASAFLAGAPVAPGSRFALADE